MISKYIYSPDDIHTNISKEELISIFSSTVRTDKEETELSVVRSICDFIKSEHVTSLTKLLDYVLDNGFYSYYRRDSKTFITLITENRYNPELKFFRHSHDSFKDCDNWESTPTNKLLD